MPLTGKSRRSEMLPKKAIQTSTGWERPILIICFTQLQNWILTHTSILLIVENETMIA